MMLAKVRHQYFLFVTTCVNRLRILSHDFIRHILRHKLSMNNNNNNNNNSNNNNNNYYYYYYYNDDNYSRSKYAADKRILSKKLYSFKFNSDISNGELKTLSKGSSPAIFQLQPCTRPVEQRLLLGICYGDVLALVKLGVSIHSDSENTFIGLSSFGSHVIVASRCPEYSLLWCS